MSRAGELLRTRAAFILTEADCLAWFGVGRATLERIEAGEVMPEPELEQRIDRFLSVCGGHVGSPSGRPPLPASVAHAGVDLAGGGRNAPAGLFDGSLHTSGGPR